MKLWLCHTERRDVYEMMNDETDQISMTNNV